MININSLFARNFPGIDTDSIKQIISAGTKIKIDTGAYLFRQNDPADVLYILISGRLRALKEEKNGELTVLGDIGEGEPVGEFAFFTEDPRMASVIAIRDSVVLKFDNSHYLDLVKSNPELASMLIRFIIKRLQRNSFEMSKTSPPKNIAVLNLQPAKNAEEYTTLIERELNLMQVPIKLHNLENFSLEEQDKVYEKLEQFDGLNILICDINQEEWSRKCLIYADLIIVATDFYASTELHFIEKNLNLYSQNILNKNTYLLLLHPENGAMPKHTSAWLRNRKVNLHIHIRKNNSRDTRRLCRILTHQANGLVLGGGGAKGFAHIGVVQALNEKGIEIDFLGGTSAGALYGIGMSFADFQFDKIHSLNEEGVRRNLTSNDITLPILSIMSGKKFKKHLKEMYGDLEMEDLWINSFAVSTNFSRAKMVVLKTGLVWRNVLASMAIPGIYPPVVIDKNLYVDGGVMDNLPVEAMYKYPVDNIIAVSLSTLEVHEVSYAEAPTSWSLAWDKISRAKKYRIPGISSIIINSLVLNSQQRQELTKNKVSHFIQLNLKGFGMLDDKKWKEIQKMGYTQTLDFLNSQEA